MKQVQTKIIFPFQHTTEPRAVGPRSPRIALRLYARTHILPLFASYIAAILIIAQ